MTRSCLELQANTARNLAELCLRQSKELDAFLADLQRSASREEFQSARGAVARIMGEIYVAALYPIFERYPDLRPSGFPWLRWRSL